MILFSCLSIYKFPLIKQNFHDHYFPLVETISVTHDNKISIDRTKKISHIKLMKEEIECYIQIKTLEMKDQTKMISMVLRIFLSLLLDILSFLCLLLLLITVYRFIALKKSILLKKVSINYHNILMDKKTMEILIIADIHYQILSQGYELLLDIPTFVVIVLMMILFPWRFYSLFFKKKYLKDEKEEKNINQNQKQKIEKKIDRAQIYISFIKGILDVIGILVLLFVLCAFWRWNYVFPSFKKIKKNEKVNIIDEKDKFYEGTKKTQMKILVKTVFIEILKDLVLLLPFMVLIIAFIYPIFIYYSFLKNNLKSKSHEFQVHRRTAQYCCLFIILHVVMILLALIIFITFIRVKLLLKNFESYKVQRKQENSQYKRNYYEAHFDFINAELTALLFLLYDLFTLFCFIIVLISFYRINEWREKRWLLFVEHETSTNPDRYVLMEDRKNELILNLAKQILLDFVCLLIFLLLCLLILWRLPTLYFIYSTPEFEKEIVMVMSLTKSTFESQSKISKLQAEIFYSFTAMIQDLPYLPIFLICFIFFPHRFFNVCLSQDGIYKYNQKSTIQSQIIEFREKTLIKIFRKGVLDFICLFEILLIIVTIIRIPFLYLIITKNRNKEKRISIHKCIHLTCCEMIKDLPYLILSIIVIIIAPWRVYVIANIVKSQKDRIPCYDNNEKKIVIQSQRHEIWILILNVLFYDYINIIMIFFLMISIYKTKIAFKVLKIAWESTYYENPKYKNYDIQKKLTTHIIIMFEDSKSVFYVIVILLLVVRVKSCYMRLLIDYFIEIIFF